MRGRLLSAALVLLAVGCGKPPDGSNPPTLNVGTPTTRSEQKRALAGKESSAVGPISAEVTGWKVEKPALVKGGTLDEEYLTVRVRFSTSDDTVSKPAWVHGAMAKDDFGNTVQFASVSGPELEGDEPRQAVRKGRPVNAVLLFEVPIQKATRVEVDIPATFAGLGDSGEFRFTIPLK